ncbi:uncharacterized protein [Arachis hypogaea]|uniref:uncharacterized protein n=1 Tax=Arachis hypogaea TaxID=3818 RepID=UPI003B212A9E
MPTPRSDGLRAQRSPRGVLRSPHRVQSPSKEAHPSRILLAVDDGRLEGWGVDLLGPFPVGPGQVKYLIVAVDYYTKWIEAEPLATISSSNCRKFMWRQRFSSVEHPQTNGQIESANKVILLGLKKRLDSKKEAWADELASVLWSYRTTEQSATGETPFRLTYGVDAMIPVEIGEPSPRVLLKGVEEAVEKDLVDETREKAHLSEVALKQRMALRYNTKVLKENLSRTNSSCGAMTSARRPREKANWEGPYKIKEVIGNDAYKLEKLDGREVPRTWNTGNLRRFYP